MRIKYSYLLILDLEDGGIMAKKDKNEEKNQARQVFFKTMILTVSAIFLIIVGYFTAGYLSGGL